VDTLGPQKTRWLRVKGVTHTQTQGNLLPAVGSWKMYSCTITEQPPFSIMWREEFHFKIEGVTLRCPFKEHLIKIRALDLLEPTS